MKESRGRLKVGKKGVGREKRESDRTLGKSKD